MKTKRRLLGLLFCGAVFSLYPTGLFRNAGSTGQRAGQGRHTCSGGEACLILADGCELTASEGIIVDPGSSLIIYAQSTGEQMGRLKATATSPNNAGIGGVAIRDNKFIMPAENVIVKAVFEKDSGSGSGGSGSGGGSSSSSSGSSGSSSSSSTTNYTLTFESNGGSAIEKVTETSGKIIDLSGYRPNREGYDFNGWYLDKDLTRKITEIRLDGNKTVYAGWTEHKTNSGISTPDSYRKSPPTGEHGVRLGRCYDPMQGKTKAETAA